MVCHHRLVTTFDLLLRGGTVIDGSGGPAVRADVGVLGDRILAVGDLSVVDATSVATVLDVAGRVVAPGFIDPHGHSDGSLFIDGALASHLHQGFTTQLSGNCGDTLAPCVIDCMIEPDVEAIMAVPWIAVCTDAEGRRPGHPVLDAGRPHPRTYGSTARVLGHYVRDRGTLSLETAIAKLSSVPAARLGLRDRGVLREGAFADLVVFDPATVADVATYADPARYPIGIEHVVVNGRPAILAGVETGDRPGRLLRRP